MDIFTEQLVTKRKSTKSTTLKILTIIAIVVLILIVLVFGFITQIYSICLLLALGIGFGGYYLTSLYSVEFEYIVTNGDIDFDKITNKSSRKRLLTINAKEFTAFGEYSDDMDRKNIDSFLDVCGNEEPRYYADFKHNKYNRTRIVFTPNDAVLSAIKPFIRRI